MLLDFKNLQSPTYKRWLNGWSRIMGNSVAEGNTMSPFYAILQIQNIKADGAKKKYMNHGRR